MPRLGSPHPGFGQMSAAFLARDGDYPPPWPDGPDPRTPECRHERPGSACWAGVQKGDRQHLCLSCDRWIWERAIWPAEGSDDGQ